MDLNSQYSDLVEALKANQQTVGFAESCTGGLIASLVTQVPGSSKVFEGAVVCYSNAVKNNVLEVSENTLVKFGAVSRETALEMALGAQKVLRVDWALSVTGIAGPDGGTDEKPVGTVWMAIVGPYFEEVWQSRFDGDRLSIQRQSAAKGIQGLLKALTNQKER
ncbi:MAG: damage-inducible protein CinA [Bdellovibrionales bacterium CG10_big_fil_rev_8_21_14_0_10_45_34]|nr:MAG: damage-inducible protein CinA [Bdellovibrionales bacterium CG10_big_fil_rev_8_21_14_0_10_45_34]